MTQKECHDYNEDNVLFEWLDKVYVPSEDSLEQRMHFPMASFTVFYRDHRKFCLPLQLFFR